MQVLHGLTEQGFSFELKGGTSLSKGYQIIDRFSEDIDIHIKAPAELKVNENPKNTKASAVESRKLFMTGLQRKSTSMVSYPLSGTLLLMISSIIAVEEYDYGIAASPT